MGFPVTVALGWILSFVFAMLQDKIGIDIDFGDLDASQKRTKKVRWIFRVAKHFEIFLGHYALSKVEKYTLVKQEMSALPQELGPSKL